MAIAIAVGAGLSWGAATAMGFARADSAAHEASEEMGAWAAARIRPQDGTWNSVREKLGLAERLSPADPAIQELLGVLYADRGDSEEYLGLGVVHFSRAVALRPTSPYTWANLAEVNYNSGVTDSRFRKAIGIAGALGPSEPEVQRTIANYGLAVWGEVSDVDRQVIDRMVKAGLRRNPLEMLQISEGRGSLALACRHLVGIARAPDPKWYQLCQSTEATP